MLGIYIFRRVFPPFPSLSPPLSLSALRAPFYGARPVPLFPPPLPLGLARRSSPLISRGGAGFPPWVGPAGVPLPPPFGSGAVAGCAGSLAYSRPSVGGACCRRRWSALLASPPRSAAKPLPARSARRRVNAPRSHSVAPPMIGWRGSLGVFLLLPRYFVGRAGIFFLCRWVYIKREREHAILLRLIRGAKFPHRMP